MSSGDNKDRTIAIVVICVLLGLFLVTILVVGGYFCYRKKKHTPNKNKSVEERSSEKDFDNIEIIDAPQEEI